MTPAFEATITHAHEPVPYAGAAPAPFGPRWLRRLLSPFGQLSPEVTDRSTGLYHRAGLFEAALEELQGMGEDAPASAVVLEFSELREVRDIYGGTIGRKVVAKVVRRVRAVAGRSGLAGRTGPSQFTVIFPGLSARKALDRVQRALGRPARVEFDAGDSEIVLVPEFLVDAMEPGGSVQGLYRDLARELSRMEKIERRRLNYLTTERERHSRPMPIRG